MISSYPLNSQKLKHVFLLYRFRKRVRPSRLQLLPGKSPTLPIPNARFDSYIHRKYTIKTAQRLYALTDFPPFILGGCRSPTLQVYYWPHRRSRFRLKHSIKVPIACKYFSRNLHSAATKSLPTLKLDSTTPPTPLYQQEHREKYRKCDQTGRLVMLVSWWKMGGQRGVYWWYNPWLDGFPRSVGRRAYRCILSRIRVPESSESKPGCLWRFLKLWIALYRCHWEVCLV